MNDNINISCIVIDGLSKAGKSSVAEIVARELGMALVRYRELLRAIVLYFIEGMSGYGNSPEERIGYGVEAIADDEVESETWGNDGSRKRCWFVPEISVDMDGKFSIDGDAALADDPRVKGLVEDEAFEAAFRNMEAQARILAAWSLQYDCGPSGLVIDGHSFGPETAGLSDKNHAFLLTAGEGVRHGRAMDAIRRVLPGGAEAFSEAVREKIRLADGTAATLAVREDSPLMATEEYGPLSAAWAYTVIGTECLSAKQVAASIVRAVRATDGVDAIIKAMADDMGPAAPEAVEEGEDA